MTIELDAISREAAALHARGVPVLLATVVRVAGSSYRRPGARMLVAEDRWLAGCVSGGCLEGDVVRRGEFRLRGRGGPVVVRYDSTSDDDIGWGFGAGCNGVVEVLLERIAPDDPKSPLAWARRVIDAEEADVMVTVFESADAAAPVGTRWFGPDNAFAIAWSAGRIAPPGVVTVGKVTALVERVEPPPRVFIIGSGHDAVPLVDVARAIGFGVTVADRHASVTQRERFAAAEEILIAEPSDVALAVDRRRTALVVLMTHDYDRDRAYLGALLGTRARYIGALGPERRTARMLAELEREGVVLRDDALGRLHAPAGLDVGAETPREIALSIVAEMQAALTGARGVRLRERRGPIHAAAARTDDGDLTRAEE